MMTSVLFGVMEGSNKWEKPETEDIVEWRNMHMIVQHLHRSSEQTALVAIVWTVVDTNRYGSPSPRPSSSSHYTGKHKVDHNGTPILQSIKMFFVWDCIAFHDSLIPVCYRVLLTDLQLPQLKCHKKDDDANSDIMTQRWQTEVVASGCCGAKGRHDDRVAEITLSMSVEAADHDAVSCISVELPQHGVTTTGPAHCLTLIAAVSRIIATIQHSEPIHSHSLLRNILHTQTHRRLHGS